MWKELDAKNMTRNESSKILSSQDYKDSCRITLEKCPDCYVITCAVYGAMVHTVFCSENDYQSIYNNMKEELQEFIDKDTTQDEELAFYQYFTNKY